MSGVPKLPAVRPLVWMGRSKRDLLEMPATVIRTFGYGLYLAQTGKRHLDAKVLKGFGDASVVEIVESHIGNAFRAVYTVRFEKAVYVLHVFQKKSKRGAATPQADLELIARRLRDAALLATEKHQ
jgi:phage-related protein